jgi:CheY-like chemotaxis protein
MKKRILLVAVENDIVHSVPITLKLAGHNVEMAGCGLEAIKRARSLLPDLVLVDSILPDMDGATVVDILRRLPSTGELRTMLFKPRQRQHSVGTEAERAPLNSSDVLAQVALALALCHESSPPELEPEQYRMRVM